MFKKYLVTGLLIWVPLVITLWVLTIIVRLMDQSLVLLPQAIQPERLLGFYIPGLGAILTLAIVVGTGVVATNIIGQKLVGYWENVLLRIPVVKSIYHSVKQVSDTLFSSSGESFRKVLLVRYPHPESWAVAFMTGNAARPIAELLPDEHVGVFIPTTPSPVNGFFFFVRKRDVIELDISVDDALKYIVSMGVVPPVPRGRAAPNPLGQAQNEF